MMIAIDGSHPRKGPENDRLRSDAGSREKHLDDDPAPAKWGEWLEHPVATSHSRVPDSNDLAIEELVGRNVAQRRGWAAERASSDFYGDLACYNDPLPPSSIRMAMSTLGVKRGRSDWQTPLSDDDMDYVARVFRWRGQAFLDYVTHSLFRPGWKRSSYWPREHGLEVAPQTDDGLFGAPRLDAVNVWVVRHQPGNDPTYYGSVRQLWPSSGRRHEEPLSQRERRERLDELESSCAVRGLLPSEQGCLGIHTSPAGLALEHDFGTFTLDRFGAVIWARWEAFVTVHSDPRVLVDLFGSLTRRAAKPSQENPLWMNWWDGLDDADLDAVGQALHDEGQALIDYADNGLRAAGRANPGDPNPGDPNPGGHDARGHDQEEW